MPYTNLQFSGRVHRTLEACGSLKGRPGSIKRFEVQLACWLKHSVRSRRRH